MAIGWLGFGGCTAGSIGLERHEYSRLLMGVQCRVVLFAADEETARQAARTAFARVEQLDGIMSDYKADSELMRLCARAGEGPVPVSRDLFDVLRAAREVSEASDGAFDVTIGPVVALWRRARGEGRRPAAAEIAAARAMVDWRRVNLDPSECTVTLDRAGTRLDLGGIGKGFACEKAVGELKARGFRRCLVALAGDIFCGDAPPGAGGWRIGVSGGRSLELENCAVSTSGDAEQSLEVDGTRYSHIVDPQSGLGLVLHGEVTIVASTGAIADALATAVDIVGPERGAAVVRRFPGARAITTAASP